MKRDVLLRFGQSLKKYRYPLLILALGVILMLLPTGGNKREESGASETAREEISADPFDLDAFTARTEKILSGISGVGRVQVLLTLETDGVQTYLSDETSRQEGEESQRQSQTVLVQQGSDEAAVSVSRQFPDFRGAVVVCQGAQDPKVTLGIKEAISSLTGLGMDKITVLKMD